MDRERELLYLQGVLRGQTKVYGCGDSVKEVHLIHSLLSRYGVLTRLAKELLKRLK